MSEKTVSTLEEWADYASDESDPEAQAVGAFADEIRTRFTANKHVPVCLSEAIESEYNGGCDCCTHTSQWFVIECGDQEHRFTLPLGDDYREVREEYADWLDEPQRELARTVAKAAKTKAAREKDQLFTAVLVDSMVDAFGAVEAEGYETDQDWHNKLMNKLGIE